MEPCKYDRGTLFVSVQLYLLTGKCKTVPNNRRYAQRRRNYFKKKSVVSGGSILVIKVNLRTIIRVNPTVQKCRATLSVMMVLSSRPETLTKNVNKLHTSGLSTSETHAKKLFVNETEGLRQFRAHRWKALGEENPDLMESIFCDNYLIS